MNFATISVRAISVSVLSPLVNRCDILYGLTNAVVVPRCFEQLIYILIFFHMA